ncbi:MAG: invasion associated locus B family protein [Bauldia sp.]|mgnify:CR=1 FL=1
MITKFTCAATLALALVAGDAVAQTPTKLGVFKDWTAYTITLGEKKGKLCYAASQPKTSQPTGLNRDPTYFMISTRPAENIANEINIIIGYPFKDDAKAAVEIDTQKFSLFTKEDGAWVESAADELALVGALKRGSQMVVKGTSRRGTNTTDTYSLAGISAALDAVAKGCAG